MQLPRLCQKRRDGVARQQRRGRGLTTLMPLVEGKGVTMKDAAPVSAHLAEGRGLLAQGARGLLCEGSFLGSGKGFRSTGGPGRPHSHPRPGPSCTETHPTPWTRGPGPQVSGERIGPDSRGKAHPLHNPFPDSPRSAPDFLGPQITPRDTHTHPTPDPGYARHPGRISPSSRISSLNPGTSLALSRLDPVPVALTSQHRQEPRTAPLLPGARL